MDTKVLETLLTAILDVSKETRAEMRGLKEHISTKQSTKTVSKGDKEQCKAKTKAGHQCTKGATKDGFCGIHVNMEAKKPEAKKPEAKKPEAKKPEAKKPEAKKSEATKEQCKAKTKAGHQCSKGATKDGLCTTHSKMIV
jgi:hypothetical protein